MSEYWPPQALSAPAVRGTNTWRHPSSRAIGRIFSPAAPPPATSRLSRGSIPWLIVMSLIAPTMWSPATSIIARAASFTSRLSREAIFATAPRGRVGVQTHPSAQKIIRIEIAEHQRRVGDRRLGAAECRSRPAPARRVRSGGRRAAIRRDRSRRSSRRRRRCFSRRPRPCPVICPVKIGPSQVSRVNVIVRSCTRLTSKLVPPASHTMRSRGPTSASP